MIMHLLTRGCFAAGLVLQILAACMSSPGPMLSLGMFLTVIGIGVHAKITGDRMGWSLVGIIPIFGSVFALLATDEIATNESIEQFNPKNGPSRP